MPKQDNFSCIPKEPLIKLDDKGQAPIVKYTMPHETSYSAKSFTPLAVERECFKEEHRKNSNIDDYSRFEGKSIEDIAGMIHAEFQNFATSRPNIREVEKQVLSKSLLDISKEIEISNQKINLQNK